MVDKVKPLKMENSATGGTENDFAPRELDYTEDYLSCKGLAFEHNDSRLIDLDGSGNIQFKDYTETSYRKLKDLRIASQNSFDNSSNGFIATNVQTAIEETRYAGSYITSDYQSSESSTTSTTNYLTKCTVTSTLASGNYILWFNFLWRSLNTDRRIAIRIYDGTNTLKAFNHFTANNSEIQSVSGCLPLISISGSKTYKLEFRVEGTGTTVYMKEALLELWRIA